MAITPIILCGGEGSRLWPVSRRDFPKQFAPLIGELSCFQQAVLRLHDMPQVGPPLIVAGEAHESILHEQLRAVGVEADIILEPEGRDSGPATAAASAYLLSRGKDGPAIMQPADHYIPDRTAFHAAATHAAHSADRGYVVTFGIPPSGPETSYGYIKVAGTLPDSPPASVVERFVEKPSREKACEYLTHGYLWNSGMFAFRPSVMLEEFRLFEPALADAVERAVSSAAITGNVIRLDPFAFGQSPKKSLDYAVMERTAKAAVVAGDFAWSDLGAWNAIYGVHQKDERGNVIAGPYAVAVESEGCFVRSGSTPVAVIGLSNVGVIAEPDGIVVCSLDASPLVKTTVESFRARSRPEALRRTRSPQHLRDYVDLDAAATRLSSWLETSALPLWWTAGADHARGGYFELLDERARPVPANRRVRVQARQAYVYARAGLCGWSGPWKAAARHGLDSLHDQYRRPDGLYGTLCDDNGTLLDDRSFLYDHAFVLLALATAAKADIDRRQCIAEATELRSLLHDRFAREGGGFSEQPARGSTFQSNPHMHLLEAALAWMEASADEQWETLADSIVQLCLARFVDSQSGMLREFFDDRGEPFMGLPGRIVEPGHQFEWAWLLCRWAERKADAAAQAAAIRLFDIGERYGIDRTRGVAIDVLLADMSPHSRQARLWPQTERLKAALSLARRTADPERKSGLEASALAAAEGLSHYLQTAIAGLWHDKMRPDGTFIAEPSPASSLYHIACAVDVLRRHVNVIP